MANIEAAVIHDHAYCNEKEKDIEAVESVSENLDESSTLFTELCLSPTYSCDSGIDYLANDLARGFGKESDDLLGFLLDDQGFLELDSDEDTCDETSKVLASPVIQPSEPTACAVGPSASKSSKQPLVTELGSADRNKKNAENARENRKKKKAYIFGLEKEVKQLRSEKNVLIGKSTQLERKANQLEEEVDYLKSIIENQSMLSKVLRSISRTPDISLSTSFCSSRQTAAPQDLESGKENVVSTRSSRKRPSVSQKESSSNKRPRKSGSTGGICLHVKENRVSLEFCHLCSQITED